MDFTNPKIRPLVYQDKSSIDQFDIEDATALDAEMLRRIECSEIITFDGANKYILDIFNNAYYITTLIMMEKHPVHYFKKYIIIAEHTSSASSDIYHNNTLYRLFSAMIMAMVCNYLRLLDDHYNHENILTRRITEYFTKEFDEGSEIFTKNLLNVDILTKFHIKNESFQPRIIDAQAIQETELLLNGPNSGWRGLTKNYNHKDIAELISICQKEEAKSVMIDMIRREADGYGCHDTVMYLDNLNYNHTIDIETAVKKADLALLRHYNILLSDKNTELTKQIQTLSSQVATSNGKSNQAELETENQRLKNESKTDNSEEVNTLKTRIAELEEQIEHYHNMEKGLAVGINQAQVALFGLSLANTFHFNYTNKKKELAPMLHKLFGFGEAKIANYLSTPCSNEERDELANLFKDLCPPLYATIMERGGSHSKATPEATPT